MADNDYEIMRKTLDLLEVAYETFSTKSGKGFVLEGENYNSVILWFTNNGIFKGIR